MASLAVFPCTDAGQKQHYIVASPHHGRQQAAPARPRSHRGDQTPHSPHPKPSAHCPIPCPPRQELEAAEAVVLAATQRPDRCIHLLRPGRLVRVRAGARDWGWGVVVSVLHTPPRAEGGAGAPTAPARVGTALVFGHEASMRRLACDPLQVARESACSKKCGLTAHLIALASQCSAFCRVPSLFMVLNSRLTV